MLDYGMKHWNSNAVCAMYIEVTGDDPRKNDIIEICLFLMDNHLNLSDKICPYYNQIVPFRPESIDYKTATLNREKVKEAAVRGIEPSLAADRLEEWFYTLDLPRNKKIIPIAYNWPAVREYLITWLGFRTFDSMFHFEYRDILSSILYINDCYNLLSRIIQYPRPEHLAYIASVLQIEFRLSDDVQVKAMKVGQVYKALINRQRLFLSESK